MKEYHFHENLWREHRAFEVRMFSFVLMLAVFFLSLFATSWALGQATAAPLLCSAMFFAFEVWGWLQMKKTKKRIAEGVVKDLDGQDILRRSHELYGYPPPPEVCGSCFHKECDLHLAARN